MYLFDLRLGPGFDPRPGRHKMLTPFFVEVDISSWYSGKAPDLLIRGPGFDLRTVLCILTFSSIH